MNDDEKQLLKVGAETAMKPLADLINKLFGGPVEAIGGMWTDGLVARRKIRQIKLFQKVQRAIEEAGFDPQPIPDKVWVPAIQEALLEDDDGLQDIWANLLANAADARTGVPPSFPKILSDMSPKEARFLNTLYEHLSANASKYGDGHERLWYTSPLNRCQLLNVYISDEPAVRFFNVDLDSLLRLRMIESEPPPIDRDSFLAGAPMQEDNPVYRLTDLGYSFVMACRPPAKS